MPLALRPEDPLWGEYTATCTFCGWTKTFEAALSCSLHIGDQVYSDPENPNFDRCNRCKRKMLKVTAVPPPPTPAEPRGFWKVPTS